MDIRTVELTKNSNYLVNKNVDQDDDRQVCIPNNMANRHRRKVQEWIDAGNTPTPYAEPVKTWEENRQAEYAKLNQFELIGEDSINGTTKHKDAILAIKAKHPKP